MITFYNFVSIRLFFQIFIAFVLSEFRLDVWLVFADRFFDPMIWPERKVRSPKNELTWPNFAFLGGSVIWGRGCIPRGSRVRGWQIYRWWWSPEFYMGPGQNFFQQLPMGHNLKGPYAIIFFEILGNIWYIFLLKIIFCWSDGPKRGSDKII